MEVVELSDMQGKAVQFALDEFPNECPICHTGIQPRFLIGTFSRPPSTGPPHLQIAFQCPRKVCESMFLGRYELTTPGTVHALVRTAPRAPEEANWSTEVAALSAAFGRIYDQAAAAEGHGLDEIAGIGYRKALEFLVKDLAIHQHPGDAEAIKKTPLQSCIETYIGDARIKSTATRGTWLGNDETHYLRLWEGHDIRDLKILIRLTVNWIDSVLLTEQYEQEMPAPLRP